MKLISIEGNLQQLDGGAMYGNAPREMWKNWSRPDEKNRIPLACRALLLQTDDGRNILFETGVGAFFDDKLRDRYGVSPKNHILLDSLRDAGFTQEDIHAVVLSHLHFDHAGGMLPAIDDGPPRLLFPRAKVYVGQDQWKRACEPHLRDKASYIPVLNDLLRNSGRLVLVEENATTDLAPLITFRFSNGHTPGLMMANIRLESGVLVFVADLIPALPWINIAITMGYDRFPELLIEEKQALLTDLAANKGKIFFTHDPQTICVAICAGEKGRFETSPQEIAELT